MKEPSFFEDEPKPNQGMRAGSLKNLEEIYKFVRPHLNTAGFEIGAFHDAKFARHLSRSAEEEHWSPLCKRFLKNRTGNLKIIHPIDDPSRCIIVQVLVIDNMTADALENRPRFNIPKELVESTTPENRIEKTWTFLDTVGVHFLVWAKTGWYWLDLFSSIPQEGYGLTYRKDKTRLNRLYTLPEYQTKKFKLKSELKEELNNRLNFKS